VIPTCSLMRDKPTAPSEPLPESTRQKARSRCTCARSGLEPR
jgi:hypothetical protein